MFRLPKNRRPTSPGDIVLEEFLKPLGMTQVEAAQRLRIPLQRLNQIVKGKRAVTPDTAIRLGRLFGTTPDVWLNLQLACDLWDALHAPKAKDIAKIKPAIAA
jgi:addiction module HigA family antidote